MVNVQNSMVGNMFPLVRSWHQNFVEGFHLRITCKDNIVFAAELLFGGIYISIHIPQSHIYIVLYISVSNVGAYLFLTSRFMGKRGSNLKLER